jgi:hypothetical protein
LFRGNGLIGLPTVTRASVAANAGAANTTTNSPTTATAQPRRKDHRQILNLYPFVGTRPGPPPAHDRGETIRGSRHGSFVAEPVPPFSPLPSPCTGPPSVVSVMGDKPEVGSLHHQADGTRLAISLDSMS